MNKRDIREVAIGAARSYLRLCNEDPDQATAREAFEALDALARENRQLIAAVWYLTSGDDEDRLFEREWKQRQRGAK